MSLLVLLLAVTPPSGAYVQIRNQGVDAGYARIINCSGTGISCTVDSVWNLVTVTVSATASDGGGSVGPFCSSGYVITSDGGAWYCVNDIATADALSANPTDCSANQYATTIAANGNLTCSQVRADQLSGQIADSQLDGGYSGVGTCSAHQWVDATNRNAAPTCAQIAYTDLSGTPIAGGSPPQVQWNGDGGLAGITAVTAPDGIHLHLLQQAGTGIVPSSGTQLFSYAPDSGFAGQLLTLDPTMNQPVPAQFGATSPMQFFYPTGSQAGCYCRYYTLGDRGATTFVTIGSTTNLATWSGSQSGVNFDAGDWIGRSWSNKSTTSTTNTMAGYHDPTMMAWRGNGTGGGFWFKSRQCIGGQAPTRIFIGLTTAGGPNTMSSPWTTTKETSSCVDCAYIGADGPDTNLSACSNDSSGTATCSTLGSNFPKTSGCYDVTWFAAPSEAGIHYNVDRLDTSVAAATGVLTSNLPANYTMVGWTGITENTDGGTPVAFQLMGVGECGCP